MISFLTFCIGMVVGAALMAWIQVRRSRESLPPEQVLAGLSEHFKHPS